MQEPLHSRNSELYADPRLVEGVDYARRHRRHERFDDSLERTGELPKTVILAPHGGGIERGTSELCLAVAGYHPTNLPIIPAAGVTAKLVLVGGRNRVLRELLLDGFDKADLAAQDAASSGSSTTAARSISSTAP